MFVSIVIIPFLLITVPFILIALADGRGRRRLVTRLRRRKRRR